MIHFCPLCGSGSVLAASRNGRIDPEAYELAGAGGWPEPIKEGA